MTGLDGRLQLDSVIRQGDTLEIRSLGFGSRSVAMPARSADLAVQLAPESVALSEVIVATVEPARRPWGGDRQPDLGHVHCPGSPLQRGHPALESGQVISSRASRGRMPILRGFEANRILLVVDGIRLNNAIYRSGHLQDA